MVADLSLRHEPVGDLVALPASADEWQRYRLSEEQVSCFNQYGYLKGIPMLTEHKVDVLRAELSDLMDPAHPGHHLFYEYHLNESHDPDKVLFHALGAWRITRSE